MADWDDEAEWDEWAFRKELKKLPANLSAIIAVRASMRVLPVLAIEDAIKGPFCYWPARDAPLHLLAMFQGYSLSVFINTLINTEGTTLHATTLTTRMTTNTVRATIGASRATFSTVRAAVAASRATAAAHTTSRATAAPHIATRAGLNATALDDALDAVQATRATSLTAVSADLKLAKELVADDRPIIQKNKTSINGNPLLFTPLWPGGMPAEMVDLWQKFKADALSLDAGFDVWLDWYGDRLEGKPIDLKLEEQWVTLSHVRRAQSPAETNTYLKHLRDGAATKPLNRVRAIFIGHGAVGKTSLIRALHGETVVEGDQELTSGIDQKETPSIHIEAAADVLKKQLDGTEIIVHFWDFGGQVMAHATHQFFLRDKCLYVIVLDAGDERAIREERNSNTEAEYWLEHVRAFGESAPVLLVGTKCDKHPVNLDMNSLKQKYANIIGFYPVSATGAKAEQKPEFDIFCRDWAENLQTIGMHKELFTKEQFAVMDAVQAEAQKKDFLPHEEFDAICTDANLPIDGPGGGAGLRDLLDKLGIIMHFPQLARLDADLLNPRWLTYGVYSLLFSEKTKKQNGRLTETDIINILKAVPVETADGRTLSYSASRSGIIIDAMEAFKVAYKLNTRQPVEIIIPSLLDENQPDHAFDIEGTLAFQFDCKALLPPHVLSNLMVAHNQDIAENGIDGTQIIWRYGVVLRPARGMKAEAMVIADTRREQILNIYVKGEDASDYLALLRQTILGSLEKMRDLPFEERVLVTPEMRTDEELARNPLGEPHYVSYGIIRTAQSGGRKDFPGNDGTYYDTAKVMRHFPAHQSDPRHQIMISYSRKDRAHVDALAARLEGAGYSVWFDKELNAAKSGYGDQIKNAIDRAKTVVVLWSENATQSEWVTAEARRGSDQKKLISIKLTDFDPSNIPLPFGEGHIPDHDDLAALEAALDHLNIRPRK